MDEFRFSVLMSVYHKECADFLNQSLKSILINQTRKPDELILICDGPLTVELDEVIQGYQQKYSHMRVFRLEANVGLGKALCYGLEKCSYDWVARMDSDDVCDERRFEKQIHYLRQNQLVDVLGGNIAEFRDDPDRPERIKQMPTNHQSILKWVKYRNPINHMTVMFRKSVIVQAGSYMDLPYMEDYYLWVRALVCGATFANIDEVLVFARIGNGMEVRRSDRKQIPSRAVIMAYMREHHMFSVAELILSNFLFGGYMLVPPYVKKMLYRHIIRKGIK